MRQRCMSSALTLARAREEKLLGPPHGDEHGRAEARSEQTTAGPDLFARWFAEGFDTLDLKQAAPLPDESAR
jgi:hypothetical protein